MKILYVEKPDDWIPNLAALKEKRKTLEEALKLYRGFLDANTASIRLAKRKMSIRARR